MIFFWCFISFVILQRFGELLHAKKNAKKMYLNGAEEFDRTGYRFIVFMHIAFFVSVITEKILLHREMGYLWKILFLIFILAQFIRYWAVTSLGINWNTRIIAVPGSSLVSAGPYKFFRHPNYVVVVIEIALIPLIFGCYYTAFFFSLMNLIVLKRRIGIEESVLEIKGSEKI